MHSERREFSIQRSMLPPEDRLWVVARHASESANSRIHLQALDFRIPDDRLRMTAHDHAERRINKNNDAKSHWDKPVKGTQASRGLEDGLDSRDINDKGSE